MFTAFFSSAKYIHLIDVLITVALVSFQTLPRFCRLGKDKIRSTIPIACFGYALIGGICFSRFWRRYKKENSSSGPGEIYSNGESW